MRISRFYSLLIPLLILLLACQTVTAPLERQFNPTSTAPPTVAPTLTETLPPTRPADTSTPTPQNTQPAPGRLSARLTDTPLALPTNTPEPTLFASPTPTPLSLEVQLNVFEQLWNTVNDEYLYPDFNGLDWNAIHTEYRQRIEGGLSNDEFYLSMDEMISRLGDDHSVFLSPQAVQEEDAQYQGNLDYVGIGVLISAVPERKRAVILAVFPDSPAAEAGLQVRDSILTVNGESILDEEGFLRDIVRGPEGTTIELTLQTPGEEARQVILTRHRITGSQPVPFSLLTTDSGKRIGYILLNSFNDLTVDQQVGNALRSMSADAPLDGLIIDNRQNTGGADTVLKPTLAYFTSGILGHFVSRNEERPLEVKPLNDVNGSSKSPLVILVGEGTISYGEVFAGVLQDTGRAYLIGETTLGNVETLWGYDFEDGSRAWIAHESFRPLDHPEQDWEQTGIIPDQTVVASIDEYPLEKDPAVQAALQYLETNVLIHVGSILW